MNRTRTLLFSALVALAFRNGSGTPQELPPAYVRIVPWDATVREVLIDSSRPPAAGPGLFTAPAGRHRILVTRDLRLWPPVHRFVLDTLLIAGDTTTVILPGILYVMSDPPDAEVTLDGRLLGHTPFWTVLRPEWFGKSLTFRKPGYRATTAVVDPTAGPTVAVHLVPIAEPQRLTAIRDENTAWRSRTFLASAATLASGVLAVHLRSKANRTYGEYQRAGSYRRMNELYDRTVRLDRWSAIAYGAFEVGFVVSFYCFLRWQAAEEP